MYVGWVTQSAPGPVWTGVENLAPSGIWSSDRPACGGSLDQQSYPNPLISNCIYIYFILPPVYLTSRYLLADQILPLLPALQQAWSTWNKSLHTSIQKLKNLHIRVVCGCSVVTSRSIWVWLEQKCTQRIANLAGLVWLPPQPKNLGAT